MAATDTVQKPVPVTIIAGFLGSGKTTLLNHILHGDHGLKVAVLVNDFGEMNIDAQLIVGVQGERMINLANGCICCTIRDDLISETLRLLSGAEPPEYIIVETSGVSDPLAVAESFLLPMLRPLIRLDSILTLIDTEQVLALEGEQRLLAEDQVGVADVVILNKVELVDEAVVDSVRGWVREIMPVARIIETSYARVPLELVLGVGNYDLNRLAQRSARDVHVHPQHPDSPAGDHDHDHDHDHADHTLIFDSWSSTFEVPFDFEAFRKAILELPISIYRAKGIVFFEQYGEVPFEMHMVGKRAMLSIRKDWSGPVPISQLVAIGELGALDATRLQALFEAARSQGRPPRGRVLRRAIHMTRR